MPLLFAQALQQVIAAACHAKTCRQSAEHRRFLLNMFSWVPFLKGGMQRALVSGVTGQRLQSALGGGTDITHPISVSIWTNFQGISLLLQLLPISAWFWQCNIPHQRTPSSSANFSSAISDGGGGGVPELARQAHDARKAWRHGRSLASKRDCGGRDYYYSLASFLVRSIPAH